MGYGALVALVWMDDLTNCYIDQELTRRNYAR